MKKVDIGNPINRIDGRQKVTGSATYAAEYNLPEAAFAVLVTSTVANGRISSIETKAAENAPGVLAIVSHLNAPKIPGYDTGTNNHGSRVAPLLP